MAEEKDQTKKPEGQTPHFSSFPIFPREFTNQERLDALKRLPHEVRCSPDLNLDGAVMFLKTPFPGNQPFASPEKEGTKLAVASDDPYGVGFGFIIDESETG